MRQLSDVEKEKIVTTIRDNCVKARHEWHYSSFILLKFKHKKGRIPFRLCEKCLRKAIKDAQLEKENK